MADPMSDASVRELREWLIDEGRYISGTGRFEEALIGRLRAAGIPVTRFSTGIPSLHPQVDSFSTLWEKSKGFEFRQFRMTPELDELLRKSPIVEAYGGKFVRCRLEQPAEAARYPITQELRQAGYTDYYIMPLPFSDGSNKAIGFSTDRPGGFSDSDIAIFDGIRGVLSVAVECRYLAHLARTLMNTYVGTQAGPRVLQGQIKRGTGEAIRAVIWFCDLRGFTELSQTLSGGDMLAILNDYFDAMGRAIADQDGEILKFIGDAILAIFPYGGRDGPSVAASRALDAAHAAAKAIDDINAGRRSSGTVEISCGIALHTGEIYYGNVGTAERLDFTAIGPAVNLASRIEGLCKETGRRLLVSEDFAAIHGGRFEDLGSFELKGIAGPRRVFAPCAGPDEASGEAGER